MDNKKHLLVVDDELLIRDLLYDHFTSCDYAISLADDGDSALKMVDEKSFDAVIVDLKMPDMDGLVLAENIRHQQEGVPVIIITGYPSVESAVEALRHRYFDYFVKPFNMKKLEKAVAAAVAEYDGVGGGQHHQEAERAG